MIGHDEIPVADFELPPARLPMVEAPELVPGTLDRFRGGEWPGEAEIVAPPGPAP